MAYTTEELTSQPDKHPKIVADVQQIVRIRFFSILDNFA